MADAATVSILERGVEQWNAWRLAHPKAPVDLSGADLSNASLAGINLSGANLTDANLLFADLNNANLASADCSRALMANAGLRGAKLHHACLRETKLAFAHLERAILAYADCRDADLRACHLNNTLAEDANFEGANLSTAGLREAKLAYSSLKGANLAQATLIGANLTAVNMEGANVAGVVFDNAILWKQLRRCRFNPSAVWRKRADLILDSTMRCKGVNAACFGSQRFKLFLQDIDFLEELLGTRHGRFTCLAWWIFADCGRSVARWAFWSLLSMLGYCLLYLCLGRGHFALTNLNFNFPNMFYYSVVTFTTLGFGDIAPRTTLAALCVTLEVITGYIMLGGLISIFSSKLARRGG